MYFMNWKFLIWLKIFNFSFFFLAGPHSVDIGPGGSVLALDTGIDTGTQLSLGDLLNLNTGLGGTSVDIGPDGSILDLDTGLGMHISLFRSCSI